MRHSREGGNPQPYFWIAMKQTLLASACALALSLAAQAQTSPDSAKGEEVKELGTVVITSGRPTSLPSQIPTTMEGIKAEQIGQSINATDSEDALKYLPSLLIRKRYIGDYNHAVLASRASGTNNSARSVVYADGILLSNFLGNGAAYAPRWGMVTPEQIDRVDVLYGPFSAAYPGNSVGAVVDYQTKMPTAFEAHGKVGMTGSPFSLYGTQTTARSTQASASVGNKNGDWSWWMDFSQTHSISQPMGWLLKPACTGVAQAATATSPAVAACTGAATAVNGAVATLDRFGNPNMVLGTTTAYDTTQDHAKIKLAYDFSDTFKASYSFGFWNNQSAGRSESYLTNAATGAAVNSGIISSGGNKYNIAATDFTMSNEALKHFMQALSLKSNTKGVFDYEVAVSQYAYKQDENRAPTNYANGLANGGSGGAGTLTNGSGTGWNALKAKGTYRPDSTRGAHIVDFGYQRDAYKLSQIKSDIAGSWTGGAATGTPSANYSSIGGNSQLQSLWGQDTWRVAADWKAVLGLRVEQWSTNNGRTVSGTTVNNAFPSRLENALSPKAAIAFQAQPDLVLKASIGRAVRFPTVQELYGNTATASSQYVNDPNLTPEKSVTSEWSIEKDLGNATLRGTVFFEGTRNSIYSQTVYDSVANANITRVQNIGRIATQGLEVSYQGVDVMQRGLDMSGSLTYTESKIRENAGYVFSPGDTIGAYQPRVPLFRATGLVGYRWSDKLTTSLGARYSGVQYTSLNNADTNGFAYQGASKFFTMDTRLRYQFDKITSMAFGIDNLNNYTYWNFHAYPQRTYHAELHVDLK
jgi:iron complex outermembrane recepter protein